MKMLNDQNFSRKVYQALLKINNFMGFLTGSLEENLELLSDELDKLYAPAYTTFCILEGNYQKVFNNLTQNHSRYKNCNFEDCWISAHALPIIVQDTEKDKGCSNHILPANIQAYASLPIMEEGRVLGVLTLNSPSKDFFTHDILEALLVMANLAGTAIHQWILFTQLQDEKKELLRANFDLKRTQNQLIQSEKLAATGRLSADIAHEINNPIGIIALRVECMLLDDKERKEGKLPEPVIEDLNVIMNQANKIARVTRSLLSFARLPVEEKNVFNLNDVILETKNLWYKHLKKKGIELSHELKPDLAEVKGNSNQMQQVLVNLIQNSEDAMPQGGKVHIVSDNDLEWVSVQVRDTGCGIRPDHLGRIFEPFFTTKEIGRGTGLGLAISYKLVEENQGKIQAESKVGEGTCVKVSLPVFKSGEKNV